MTIEELKIQSLQLELFELGNYITDNRNKIKLLFSSLIINHSNNKICIELVTYIHSNRKNEGINSDGIQFLLTNLAFYFKSANKKAFVYTCITNLDNTILKYRLEAWYHWKDYTKKESHVKLFTKYLDILSLSILDDSEDYIDEVLSDLHSYHNDCYHISGFKELFVEQQLLQNYPILKEYNERKHVLDYIIGEHPDVEKIFTPSIFTEQLFNEKFINYIKYHKLTRWHLTLLGLDALTIRSEVLNFGQANFDKAYGDLQPDDIVKLYCYFNMRKHYYSSLYLFERCDWIKKLISQVGCLKFIDVGCGPATSGIALTDYLLADESSNQKFDYIGIDFYESMLSAASDLMDNSAKNVCSNNRFVKRLSELAIEEFENANSIIINTCYLFASPTLDVEMLSNEINTLIKSSNGIPIFLLFQNTTVEEKNINYNLFKERILKHDVLLSEKLTIKYNNQKNSYQPVKESVFFEVLKFNDYV